jgi:hypothetical protein
LTRTDQKPLSLDFASLWKLIPGLAGLIWRSKAVVFAAFCSSPESRDKLSVFGDAEFHQVDSPPASLRPTMGMMNPGTGKDQTCSAAVSSPS